MLHQSAQSSDEFLGLIAHLRDDFRLISLDLPGHGGSDTPGHELGVDEYCEAVVAVLDAMEVEKAHVLGHHGGCMLATNLANQHPHRVVKLILSGGGIPDPAVADLLLNQPMTRDLPMDPQGNFLVKTWNVYQNMAAPGTELETVFWPFVTGLNARQRPYDMHFEVLRWDYSAALDVLSHPALLIKAEHDAFSGDVEGLHRQLQSSEMVVITRCGPWLFYERPEACALVIRTYLGS
ncbi:MAG: alpha/beta fold hydrolase [Woeseiaceae bacterium]